MIEKALAVDGWMSVSELAFLYAIASKMPEGARVVEVGSWKGRSTVAICEALTSCKDVTMRAIDTWQGDPHILELENARDLQEDGVYKTFCANTAAYGFLKAERMTSLEAAPHFENGSLDWVFIDAFHEYESVSADIQAWYPKLKPGGLISGHDYGYLGINRALRVFFGRVCAWDTIWYARVDGAPLKRRALPLAEFALRRTLLRQSI